MFKFVKISEEVKFNISPAYSLAPNKCLNVCLNIYEMKERFVKSLWKDKITEKKAD